MLESAISALAARVTQKGRVTGFSSRMMLEMVLSSGQGLFSVTFHILLAAFWLISQWKTGDCNVHFWGIINLKCPGKIFDSTDF